MYVYGALSCVSQGGRKPETLSLHYSNTLLLAARLCVCCSLWCMMSPVRYVCSQRSTRLDCETHSEL